MVSISKYMNNLQDNAYSCGSSCGRRGGAAASSSPAALLAPGACRLIVLQIMIESGGSFTPAAGMRLVAFFLYDLGGGSKTNCYQSYISWEDRQHILPGAAQRVFLTRFGAKAVRIRKKTGKLTGKQLNPVRIAPETNKPDSGGRRPTKPSPRGKNVRSKKR